jgi:uncharacterized short protein YbdD (DUF466 family)
MPERAVLADRLAPLLRRLSETAKLMIGVPDYDNYVAHRRQHHPDEPIMTYEQFFRERQDSRYGFGKGKFKGCC